MEDHEIVELYLIRSEDAIAETQKKYGAYCHYIAYNILYNTQDAQECVNDTYVGAWNTIPPQKPSGLKYYLAAITRKIALGRFDYNMAKKRSCETVLALDELCECIPITDDSPESKLLLKDVVDRFLASLDPQSRIVFMRRYWYLCSVREISAGMGLSQSNVKVMLHRTRKKFKAFLEREGVTV